MDIRILGRLEALDEGRTIALGAGKQRALLALLVLHANQTLSAERLIEELWGEHPPATAAKTLQVHVSRLRKALGGPDGNGLGGSVVTREHGYELRLDPERLDAHRFERLVAEGRSALAAGSAQGAVRALEQALALWRGRPLDDLAFEPFAQREIARLAALRIDALEELIAAKLALGRHGEVIGELETLIAEQPYRERLRAHLMLALYRCDRQADALQAYHEARRTLVEELGIEPGQRLRDLERAVLEQDPALILTISAGPRRAASRPARAAADPPTGTFVGRERELERLRGGLEAAIAGRGSLHLLVGEPGIGKSRLADELMRQARAAGVRVLVGRCWEAGGAPTYWPWVQALRMYVETTEPDALRVQLGAGGAELAQLLPELRELFPDLPEPPAEAEGARLRLFDAAARFLVDAAGAGPLLVVLDDLHAADEPSLLLLRFVAGALAEAGILVVGTYRDVGPTIRDPLAATLGELGRERITHRIALAGLTEADVGRYIELSTATTPAPQLVTAIHSETEGNPLFVGEIVRLLSAEGRLEAIGIGGLSTLGIPQGVREVIGRRLARLSEECRHVLTLASVLGRELRLDALERLSDLDSDRLLDVLDEAVTERLLSAVPGGLGRLRFAHALIRETLYEGLTTPRRVQLHRRAGRALEALYREQADPHLAELAHHFFQAAPAGEVDKAISYTERAAARALKLLAYEEAARLFELGLQALEVLPSADPATHCELLLGLGEALAREGRTADAKRTYLAAADLARASGLPHQLGLAALGYGGRFPWLRAGSDARLVPLLEEALAALGAEESVLRVRLLARLAGALRDQPSLEPRSSLAHQAVEVARRLGDPDTLCYALTSQFTATWGPEMEELAAIADELRQRADETGDAERILDTCFLQRETWLALGDRARVATAAAEHRALADELKQPSQQWYATVMSAHWALSQGDFALAEQLGEEALALGERVLRDDAICSHRMVLCMLRIEQGRAAEVEELVRRSIGDHPGYRFFRCLLVLIACELGREGEARPAFDELAADDFADLPRDAEWLFALCTLAQVAVDLGDRERARALYRLLRPYAHLNAVASGEVFVGSVARYLGMLAAASGASRDAARHFEDALEMNERMGARPWLAHTQSDYARMRLGRDAPGDREQARTLLSRALATYRELGMPVAAERASALAAGAGISAP